MYRRIEMMYIIKFAISYCSFEWNVMKHELIIQLMKMQWKLLRTSSGSGKLINELHLHLRIPKYEI